jgi:DNA/RNA endonuclease G (NUC1)
MPVTRRIPTVLAALLLLAVLAPPSYAQPPLPNRWSSTPTDTGPRLATPAATPEANSHWQAPSAPKVRIPTQQPRFNKLKLAPAAVHPTAATLHAALHPENGTLHAENAALRFYSPARWSAATRASTAVRPPFQSEYTDHPPIPLNSPTALADQRLGLPQTNPAEDPNAIVLARKQSVVVYYPEHKIPKLVSWVTRPSDLQGQYTRTKEFHEDPYFNGPKANPWDYKGEGALGLTRGHMLRSGERASGAANYETFNLTNVVPQAANNNAGPWLHLENYYRDYVHRGFDAYVQSGSILEGPRKTIGDGVTVPSHTWKTVVVVPTGKDPTSTTVEDVQAGRVRAYAVIVPNNNQEVAIGDSFARYEVPISEIAQRAKLTGLLSGLPQAVRDELSKPPVVRPVRDGFELNGEFIPPPEHEHWEHHSMNREGAPARGLPGEIPDVRMSRLSAGASFANAA